jgi:hypothetical protein
MAVLRRLRFIPPCKPIWHKLVSERQTIRKYVVGRGSRESVGPEEPNGHRLR